MRDGLMMDDFPLSLTARGRAGGAAWRHEQGRLAPARRRDPSHDDWASAPRRPAGWPRRWRGSASSDGDRVATLLWNQPEHLELYFAIPLMGAVIHTLNPRLHPDELSFIVADAEDRAIVVDESLLEVFESFRSAREFEHVIVVTRSGAGARTGCSTTSRCSPTPSRPSGPSSTSAARRPCVTRRARRADPRASSTRTARWSCTRWWRRCPDSSWRLLARHDPPGGADVPRQRLGAALRGGVRRRRPGAARAHAGRRRACSTCSPTSG